MEELLPTTSRSVKDLHEVTSRLNGIENIVVLISSDDTKGSKRFVEDLAAALNQLPKDMVSSIEYKIDTEIRFFKQRQSLFIDVKDLEKIRDYIQSRLAYEKELYNPLNIFSERNILEPKLDFEALKKKYETEAGNYAHLPGGYYATDDQKARLISIYMQGHGLDKARRLKGMLIRTIDSLHPSSYAPDLKVRFTGNLEDMIEESAALVQDLELSTAIVIALVTLAMILFYRSFLATWALVFSLFMGTFWAFGISYFLVGYLNANSAFLMSIVIGNGINFGIIFLARYLEERRAGGDNATAVESAMLNTATPTLTAALAAALSYGSLMLTRFRGFNQFGTIGLVGMILCWISAYTLLPAYLTLIDRWLGPRWKFPRISTSLISGITARIVDKAAFLICLIAATGAALSFFALRNYNNGVMETDMSKLRDKRCMMTGSGSLYHYIDDIFRHSLSPTVILPKTREDMRKIADLLRIEKKKEEKDHAKVISMVQTLEDFVPKDQTRKIELLKEIKKLLPERYVQKLSPEDKRLIDELLSPESFHPFSEKDLPPLILGKFREKDGSVGKIVLVDKVILGHGRDDANALIRFITTNRKAADTVAPGTAVAGTLPISFDMLEAIVQDGPKATFFAFLAVVLLVVVLFRRPKTIALILFALILGVTWFAGIILAYRLKINFLNFIAFPITFGIGVDYGVNIFKRYEEEGKGSIVKVIRNTGGAVMLSSFTTIIGYSSLLIAGNQAFVSFGTLAVLGELTCVSAAVIALPAFLRWREPNARVTLP